MLKESLANALHDPAVDLALEQERVDGAAEIVDHRIAFNGNCPGIRIDLDLDDVAAVRESLCRRRARMCCVETVAMPGGSLAGSRAAFAASKMFR